MNINNHFRKQSSRISRAIYLAGLLLFLTGFSYTRAGTLITSGTYVKVTSGSGLVSAAVLDIRSGGTLNNSGNLNLQGNLINENTSPNSLGSGMVALSGSTNQTISGQNIIQEIDVFNPAGVTLGGNTTVNGHLGLYGGNITLGSNNLQLGPSSFITGTTSAMVVTGTGELRKVFVEGFTGSFTYPVGDNTGTAEYSPVTVNFTGGTFSSGNYLGVNVVNAKYPNPNITGNYLNRYWTLDPSGIAGFTCNATFQYVPADVTGTESKISCTMVNPLPWITYSLTNASTHVMTASGVVSFGSFTGVKSTTAPANQDLTNIDIPSGTSTCYDATQVLTVAGSGSTFLVENGGNVTLVAGIRILLMDGTKVNSGGYLHGYITTNDVYCGSGSNPVVKAIVDTNGFEPVTKNQLIRVYPNPTTDNVVVELIEATAPTTFMISVYNMQGGKLLEKTVNGEPRFQFSLSDKPVGVYIVHVQSEQQSDIAKVIKH